MIGSAACASAWPTLCLRRRPEPGLREPKFAEPKFGGRRKRKSTEVRQLGFSTQVERRRTRVWLRRKHVTQVMNGNKPE